ncbi:hypothetical protein [Proteus phage 2207-N35]|nr:hypothetical protein [Proteus phage 2207-N35]
MIREVIESFGFTRVTNSKYVKSDITLVLDSNLNITMMNQFSIRTIKVKDILGARDRIKNFLKHVGEL